MGVLVHEVVEVCDLPISWSLVGHWQDIEQLRPLQVGLEAHNVLRGLLVVVAQQDLRVVLVLHEELHGRVNQGGNGHIVRFVLQREAINNVALIVDWGVICARGSEQG